MENSEKSLLDKLLCRMHGHSQNSPEKILLELPVQRIGLVNQTIIKLEYVFHLSSK